jgi:hypothetical protein
MTIKTFKEFLLSTPLFSGKVPPIWANISHYSLGALIYGLFGWPALFFPLLKEGLDLWLWEKKLFSKHHKLYKDLAGWYCGMLTLLLIQTICF